MQQKSIADARDEKSLACAMVCDHKLAIPAGALATRIATLWNVDVHIFVERPEGNREPIMETRASRVTYHYEKLFVGLHDLLPDHPRFSRATWGRIFLSEVLSSYNRILYCDIDILPGPLPAGLENINLPHGIAMVRDSCPRTTGIYSMSKKGKVLTAFSDVKSNYNAGVILIDPNNLDSSEMLAGLIEFFKLGGIDAAFQDQDFLNYFFGDRVVELSPNLNFQQSLMGLGLTLQKVPAIRHFCHSVKPYHSFPRYGVSELTRKASVEFRSMAEDAMLMLPKLKPYDKALFFRGIKAFSRYAAERSGIKLPKSRQLESRWWDQRNQTLKYLRDGVAQGRFADVNVFDLTPPEPQLRFNGLEILPVHETMQA